jgi:hypothetical protein
VGKHNAEMEKIIKNISDIKANGQKTGLKEQLDILKLFPSMKSSKNDLQLI